METTRDEAGVIDPWMWQSQYAFVHGRRVPGAHSVLHCAGQTSVDEHGRPIHEGDMAAQLTQAFNNLETVLNAAGFDLSNVVRLNYYTTDVDGLFACYEIVTSRLATGGANPCSTLLGVTWLTFPELLVELEATASG